MRGYLIKALAGLVGVVAVAMPLAATTHVPAHRAAAAIIGLLVGVHPGPDPAMLSGAVLVLLARGLLGGRWLAGQLMLWAVLAGLVLTGPAASLAGADPAVPPARRLTRVAVGLAVVGALLGLRHHLPVRPHPRRTRTAAQLAAVGLGAAIVHAGWLVQVSGDSPLRSARLALSPAGTAGVLALVAAGCAIAALAVALAAAPPPPPGDPGERATVAALVSHP